MIRDATAERRETFELSAIELAVGDLLTFAREEDEDTRRFRWSFVPAIVLHVLLFAIQLPQMVAEAREVKKQKVYVVQEVRFKPPPPKQQQEIPKLRAKKIPIPSPTLGDPEPIRIEENIEPEFDPVEPDLIFGIPDGPPSPEPGLDAYWNSWVLPRPAAQSAEPVESLQAKRNYTISIDLAGIRYPIRGVAAARAEADLRTSLATAIEEEREVVEIVVRATVLGRAVEIIGGTKPGDPVKILLDRLRQRPVRSDGESLAEFSERARAAQIYFDLRARKKGCATVAISISEYGSIRPIDHLVRTVRVVDKRGKGPPCGATSELESGGFSAGLATLLAYRNAPTAEAALQVFEVGDSAAAFFVRALPGADTAATGEESTDRPVTREKHWAWELRAPLTDYLKDEGRLQALLRAARDRRPGDPPVDYGTAGKQLRDQIFKAERDDDEGKAAAKAALGALEQLVSQAPEPPTVLARLVDAEGDILFMPIRLLSATLGKPFSVVYPLPNENYTGEPGCIDSWTVAVPDRVSGVDMPTPAELKTDSAWLHREDDSLSALRSYLTEDVDRPETGEGLVLLAHHAEGRVWYRDDEEPILAEDIERTFGPGSVAVLAICSAGSVEPADLSLLRTLNDAGIEAVILSPFELYAEYGKAFALEFLRVVREAEANEEAVSFSQLFSRATLRLKTEIEELGDMDLELQIVGNHDIKLCPAERSPE